MKRRLTIYGVLVALVIGLFAAVVPASASVKGRRNTAWALTGAAAYELLRGKTAPGLVLGAGAAYAWKRTHDEKRAQQRQYTYYYDNRGTFYYDNYGRRHYVSHRHYASRPHHRSYAYQR